MQMSPSARAQPGLTGSDLRSSQLTRQHSEADLRLLPFRGSFPLRLQPSGNLQGPHALLASVTSLYIFVDRMYLF